MSIKQRTPQIRFSGFNEDWVQKKLVEEVAFYSGLTYTPNDVVDKSGTLVLRSSNVQNGAIALGDNVYVKSEVVNSQNVEVGDSIVVVRNGSRNLIGKHAMITKPMDNTVIGAFMTGIRAPVPSFFNTLLDTQEFHDEVSKNLGATINQITGGMFKAMSFYLPESDEQTAIGNLFQTIDKTIALQRRKHEQTQTLKKSLLSKMFPKKGQKQPEIRLAGFGGNWVESKFFDNIESIIDFRGRTPKKIGLEWSEKGYLALSALNVKNGYIDFNLDKHFGNEELYQKWMGGKELVAGQVLFTTEAPMGNVAQVPDNKGYILSQRTIAFNIRKDLLTDDFLAILLKSPVTFNMLESMSSGGTAKGVSQKSLANLQVVTPQQLEEQTAIGQFFKQIDDTLSLQAKQLKSLENLKKALLAKMFV